MLWTRGFPEQMSKSARSTDRAAAISRGNVLPHRIVPQNRLRDTFAGRPRVPFNRHVAPGIDTDFVYERRVGAHSVPAWARFRADY